MTDSTKSIIRTFVTNGDLNLVPPIIIGMQEEDNASSIIRGKNRFNILRNYCAHEPNSVIASFKNAVGKGYSSILIDSKDDGYELNLDTATFVIWFIDIYMQTKNDLYMKFIAKVMSLIYGKSIDVGYNAAPMIGKGDLLNQFNSIQNWWFKNYNKIKMFNPEDKYMTNMYKDNPKMFWRIVIPNFTEFVLSIFDTLNKMEPSGYQFILNIAAVRNEIINI